MSSDNKLFYVRALASPTAATSLSFPGPFSLPPRRERYHGNEVAATWTRCVTTQVTAARETIRAPNADENQILILI